MSEHAKICLEGVKKGFGPKVVLDGIDLEVTAGESLVVIGGSGSGKSVMIKCILGLLKPDAGRILVDGEDIVNPTPGKRRRLLRRFGMLFQGSALFDSLKVWENVAFGLIRAHDMEKAAARDVAIEKLARVGLGEDVATLYPDELSGGMKKRVALARAIAANPEIIFFDEPTTGLDPIMADVINGLITECVKDLGATTLTITHDMSSVHKIADKAAMLHGGKIIWHGSRKELANTKNPFVRQFVAGSADGPIKMALLGGV